MVSCPENIIDKDNISIHVMHVLQSTLDLEELIGLFHHEMMNIIPHDHLCYENQDESVKFELGKLARYSSNYCLVLFDRSLGELTISRDTRFPDTEIDRIKELVATLIYPLRNAFLYKKAIKKAYIDPLTGMNNRAAFNKSLEQEINLATRHNHTLSLMMLDLDRFKKINDNYGHIVGDEVLKRFADCIMEYMRRSDIIFRYGGEEFSILLRNTHIAGARLLAERIRKSVEEIAFVHKNIKLSISVSIGLSELIADDDQASLIERADDMLYKAKRNGRNCVMPIINE